MAAQLRDLLEEARGTKPALGEGSDLRNGISFDYYYSRRFDERGTVRALIPNQFGFEKSPLRRSRGFPF